MTEKEFWEDDPQLYWSYHIFYIEKLKQEQEEDRYKIWLKGNMSYIAYSSALSDAFSKDGAKGFPKYEDMFKSEESINYTESVESKVTRTNTFWARQ